MGNRWDGSPPDDAHERHSRDLADVTAGFARVLDELPQRLTSTYDCTVRPATADEVTLMAQGGHGRYDASYAVQPAAPGASPLLVGRGTFAGGVSADVAFGRFQAESVPHCFCDACDETSEDLIGALERAVAVTVGGFEEFSRKTDGVHEVGWSAGGGGSHASMTPTRRPVDEWRLPWEPWTPR